MKILVVPDSFKGSMTSNEVCNTIKNSIVENSKSDVLVETVPFADGGEGFAEAMKDICAGEKISIKCHNIYNQEIDGYIVTFGDTAVIECATASGLLKRKNVMQSSSYGTGELIRFAYEKGYKNIILGLGGTGCCDGGIGVLSALGGKFYDENWNVISRPKSNDMNYIFGVDLKNLVRPINFIFACDVDNVYYGKNGAAYVFAPQKGANKTDTAELDNGLQRLNAFFKNDVSTVKGAGAAGGICGGLYSAYGGEIKSGFDILKEYSNLEDKIRNADVVITGEGKTDSQTLMGKLPFKVSELCNKYNKKCVIISGSIEDVKLGDKMISLVGDGVSLEDAIAYPIETLAKKVKNSLEIILE